MRLQLGAVHGQGLVHRVTGKRQREPGIGDLGGRFPVLSESCMGPGQSQGTGARLRWLNAEILDDAVRIIPAVDGTLAGQAENLQPRPVGMAVQEAGVVGPVVGSPAQPQPFMDRQRHRVGHAPGRGKGIVPVLPLGLVEQTGKIPGILVRVGSGRAGPAGNNNGQYCQDSWPCRSSWNHVHLQLLSFREISEAGLLGIRGWRR